MNDNKLIAEFMGRGGTFNHDETMICTGIYPDTMTLMKYHTSWDWLMPVVQKCYESGAEGDCIGDITMYLTDVDIQSTYKAVVKFIKTYSDEAPTNEPLLYSYLNKPT